MVYLAVIFMVFMIVLAASAAAVVWQVEVRRSKEKELLFQGQQFAYALASYQLRHAGSPRTNPTKLKDLLKDGGGLVIDRDLRRIYVDPLTGTDDWGLIRMPDGEITGVYSRSSLKPIQTTNFPTGFESFGDAKHYSDWIFRATKRINPDPWATAAPAAALQTVPSTVRRRP